MKLSFSIKGWNGYSWDEFCALAKDMDIQQTLLSICVHGSASV